MKKSNLKFIFIAILALFTACTAQNQGKKSSGPLQAEPGTIESLSNPLMDKVSAAQKTVAAGPDDVVIYYYRPDGAYKDWGFWIWAFPGGDGATSWNYSQNLQSTDGVGYLKFKRDGSDIGAPLVGAQGTGIIARRVDGWTKDGNDDRIFNTTVTNEWVIFSNDQKTYPFGVYRPSIDSAILTELNTVQVEFSGRHALDPKGSDNGFVVQSSDGSIQYRITDMYNSGSPDNRNQNFTKRATMVLDKEVDLSLGLKVSNPAYQLPVAVSTVSLAAAVAEKTVPAPDYELGLLYKKASAKAEFRIWSPLASGAEVHIYKKSLAPTPDWTLPMLLDKKTGVWSATFSETDPDGMFYDFDLSFGALKNRVLDPYAKSMDVFIGSGVGRAAIVDNEAALPPGGWESFDDVQLAQREDAIIYEVSVRDFTISPDAKVKNRPGSYLAFIEKLPYIKSLGVTHIQLMPVLNFYYTDEGNTAYENSGTASGNNYNWGYDPHSYFTPEGWFASDPANPYARMIELKTLVKEAHKLGLGVLLDVVYNHTAKTSMLNDAVPSYYYRLNSDGSFRNNSGVGNDTASERTMMRRLIVDSTSYLAREYKIDGFRFDLMGLIDADTILEARAKTAAVPGKSDIFFEGEGWKMYNGPKQTMMDQNYMTQTDLISVFNDEFRDILKGGGLDDRALGFLSDKHINPKLLISNLLGKPALNYAVSDPGNNLQYTEAHDNLTMRDNLANNVNLDDKNPSQRAELIARLRMGNFFVLTAQGVSFLHAGQERGRSKPKLKSTGEVTGNYVHNSYDAADNINQFIWNPHPDYLSLNAYTAGLIDLRRNLEVFRLGDPLAIDTASAEIPSDGTLAVGWSLKGKDASYYMLANGNKKEKRVFTLPQAMDDAVVLVDQTRAEKNGLSKPKGLTIDGATITLEPLTAILIRK